MTTSREEYHWNTSTRTGSSWIVEGNPGAWGPSDPAPMDTITHRETEWVRCNYCNGRRGFYAADLIDQFNRKAMIMNRTSRPIFEGYIKSSAMLNALVEEYNGKIKAWNSKF